MRKRFFLHIPSLPHFLKIKANIQLKMTNRIKGLFKFSLIHLFFLLLLIYTSCKKDPIVVNPPLCTNISIPMDGTNRLAADDISNEYRTGVIDPAVLNVPAEIDLGIKTNPAKYSPQLVRYFLSNSSSNFQTVKRLHDWITFHIAYDNDYFYGIGTGNSDPENVLKDGKTTCGGFANLLAYFCDFANIETVKINGISRVSFNSNTNEMSNHVWLAVVINCTWYIVDATHDSRFSYNNGVFGAKGNYSDTYLFVSPKAKIIMNYPNLVTHQFLESPVSKSDFLAHPLVNLNYVKYGLRFDPDFKNLITKEKSPDHSDHLFTIFDVLEVADLVTFGLSTPSNVAINAKVLKSDGTYYENYAFEYLQDNKVICQYAAPPVGEYKAYISASFLDPYEIYSQKVYEFTLRSSGDGSTTVPSPGMFYILPNNLLYKVEIIESNLSTAPYSLTVKHSLDFELFSGIYISNENNVQLAATATVINSDATSKTVRYDYPPYSSNDYLLLVKAKNAGDPTYSDIVIKARIRN